MKDTSERRQGSPSVTIWRGLLSNSARLPPWAVLSQCYRNSTASFPELGAGHDLHPHGARLCLSLTAVVDVTSRWVLSHKVATTLEASHALGVIEQAFASWGTPEIVNTD